MKKIIPIVLTASLLLSGCSLPFNFNKKNNKEQTSYELTPVSIDKLQDGQFYVKNGDNFYPSHLGRTNLTTETAIAKKTDPTRIISFTKDDELIPTLYKDDELVYYSSKPLSEFTLERYKDNGWSVGFYNLQPDESNKVKYVIGESNFNKDSTLNPTLIQLQLPQDSALLIIDRVGGKTISAKDINESGVITGLKAGAVADIDMYAGTQHIDVPATVDTHILSSMEVYKLTEYSLNENGYAIITIPEYLLSGYYFINGVGVFRYIDNDRADGIAGVDFSVPYLYKDENGKEITKEEYDKLMGNKTEEEKKTPSSTLTVNIDATQKIYKCDILYDLKGDEDPTSLNYKKPSAELVSETGEVYEFTPTKKNNKECFSVSVDGIKSGKWTINIYNLDGYDLNYEQTIESGNADSFVHSGSSEGTLSIYTDGISGNSKANVIWENSGNAVDEATIISPSGTEYTFNRTGDQGQYTSTYGNLSLALPSIEPGTWTLKVKGTDLGRVWFNFEQSDEPAAETSIEETEAGTETEAESGSETEVSTETEETVAETETAAET